MRARIDQAVDAIRAKLNEPDDGCMSPDYWSGLGIALDAVTEAATAAPAETEERGTGWRPIAEAPKGRDATGKMPIILLIGTYPTGHWSDVRQGWWDDLGGCWERWSHAFPPSHFMIVTTPQPTATATREDGHA